MSTETNVNADDNGGFELTSDQLDVLMQHKKYFADGVESRVVPASAAKVIDRLDITADSLADMSNPQLVDAGPTDAEALRDVAAACRRLNDPVVVEKQDAESLESARDGLAKVVSTTTGIDAETAESMSCAALSSAVRGTAKAAASSSVSTLDDLAQNPETGGAPDGDALEANHGGGVEALSGDDRAELRDIVRRHDMMADRAPDHASELESEALELAGDADSLDEVREAL